MISYSVCLCVGSKVVQLAQKMETERAIPVNCLREFFLYMYNFSFGNENNELAQYSISKYEELRQVSTKGNERDRERFG